MRPFLIDAPSPSFWHLWSAPSSLKASSSPVAGSRHSGPPLPEPQTQLSAGAAEDGLLRAPCGRDPYLCCIALTGAGVGGKHSILCAGRCRPFLWAPHPFLWWNDLSPAPSLGGREVGPLSITVCTCTALPPPWALPSECPPGGAGCFSSPAKQPGAQPELWPEDLGPAPSGEGRSCFKGLEIQSSPGQRKLFVIYAAAAYIGN